MHESLLSLVQWILASKIITDKHLRDLALRLDRIRKAVLNNDEKSYFSEDRGFHLCIALKTRNVFIINTISYLIQTIAQPLWQTMKQGLLDMDIKNARIKEHEKIYEAIVSKYEKAILEMFLTHLENSRKRLFVEL